MHVTDRTRLRKQYADDARLAVRIETHRRYSERRENIADWVLGLLGPQPGNLVLDAGAGSGSYHPALETRQVRAVAVERELGMIRSASDSQAAFVAGDVSELPLASDMVDHSMANHMLYFVPDIPRALAELARVTRPGGRVAPDDQRQPARVAAAAATPARGAGVGDRRRRGDCVGPLRRAQPGTGAGRVSERGDVCAGERAGVSGGGAGVGLLRSRDRWTGFVSRPPTRAATCWCECVS